MGCSNECIYFHAFYDDVEKRHKLVCDYVGKEIHLIKDRHNCKSNKTSWNVKNEKKGLIEDEP
jgi:hypothetical protein